MPAARERTPSTTATHAAAHATRNIPVAYPGMSAGEVRAALVGQHFDTAAGIVVLEGDRLAGIAPAAAFLGAMPETLIDSLMDTHPPTVHAGIDQEQAAWRAAAHGGEYVAVVDHNQRFAGLIPAGQMLQVLLEERNEDLARRAGEVSVERARTAVVERMPRRLWHRLPWLFTGLAGAMAAAGIVGAFEAELEQRVMLAFFLPAIIYISDAVGTQTETLIIRAMSAGVSMRELARGESVTGVVVGAVLGTAAFLGALLGWGDAEVALTLAIGIVASCSIATLFAMSLPILLTRAGVDPAFGSGPIATVMQDVTTVVIYLSVARIVLG
ncbi:MAG: magnesium transporter [Chloroflexi bacterium]|nr:magnesium transporter [Chloroflexota bacterium]MQC16913.1 magnesium transporter [Chloroflexota bacterium]